MQSKFLRGVTNFFKEGWSRFFEGDEHFAHNEFEELTDSPSILNLPFDQHPGPINLAITDSITLGRPLLIFLYSPEHKLTHQALSLFSLPEIATEIREKFTFLSVLVTTHDGIRLYQHLSVISLPVLALIRPRGRSLESSNVFYQIQGELSQSALQTLLSSENPRRRDLINEQNEAYQREEEAAAALEAQNDEDEILRETEEAIQESLQEKIDRDFENLPNCENLRDSITVKFIFPDGVSRTKHFLPNAPVASIFVFVRKYQHPTPFRIVTGFPQITLEDTEDLISSVVSDRHFVVHVDED